MNVSVIVAKIIVSCVGLLGNALVIFVIIALKEYQRASNHWYVLQLAVADFFFLVTLPFNVAESVNDEWVYSGTLCKMKEAILFINYYSSVLFLMVMSVDRYIAVCHTFDSRLQKVRKRKSARVITVIAWIVAVSLSIPIIIYSDKRGVEPECLCSYDFSQIDRENPYGEGSTAEESDPNYQAACVKLPVESIDYYYANSTDYSADYYGEEHYEAGCSYAKLGKGWATYVLFNFIAMFLIPFMLMLVCYIRIAMRLMKAHHRRLSIGNDTTTSSSGAAPLGRRRSVSHASNKAERKRMRVTYLCLTLVVFFVMCWLPYHAVHLAKLHGISVSAESCDHMLQVTTIFVYVNSALNPYIYNFIGTDFKKKLRSAGSTTANSLRRSKISSSFQSARYTRRKRSSSTTVVSMNSFVKDSTRSAIQEMTLIRTVDDVQAASVPT